MFSYICFITNESYLPGLKVLKSSLDSVNSIYPLHVVVKNDISHTFLEKIKNIVTDNRIIKIGDIPIKANIKDSKYSHWAETFFKLNVARLIQFKKVIMLDLDLLILKNIDELFQWPHLSAVTSGKIANQEWDMFNSGVLVIEPNIEYFNNLMLLIEPVEKKLNGTFGDQDIFQASIPNWEEKTELHLPEIYNEYYRCAKKLAATLENGWNDIKVLHFWGKKKPWNYTKVEIFKYYIENFLKRRNDVNKCVWMYRKFL